MLALLPPLTLVGLFLALGNRYPEWGWRRTLLRASVLSGAFTVLVTEGLSLVKAITPLGLGLAWLAPSLGLWGWLVRMARRGDPFRFPKAGMPASWGDRALLLCIAGIALVTVVVAWLAPPNTWDSLTYHMSRVAHWAQNRSVAPYATGIERQNFMSPGAEMAVLQLYVLSRGDRLANFVEWSAMLASVIGVTLIARQLGARAPGQWVAAVFAATLPMGIAQASSTMTDYVVALWVVAVASESISMAGDKDPRGSALFASLAAGLAVLTKPTSLAYLAPFALWIAITLISRHGIWTTLRMAIASGLAILVLNAGYFGRNLVLEGSPAGGRELASAAVNETLTWQGLVSNLLRNASIHAGTPWPELNEALYLAIAKVHVKIGLPDVSDLRFSRHDVFLVRGTNTEENRTPNTQHAVVLLLCFPLTFIFGRKVGRLVVLYALAVAATFLLFSAIFKFDLLASRYHLPFFVLASPAVGAIVGKPIPLTLARGVALLLVALSWTWLVGIENRQLLRSPERSETLLNQSRSRLYVSGGGSENIRSVAKAIEDAQCLDVGIMLCGDCPEYVLWAYLGAPRGDLRMEWIVAGTPSERYAPPDFRPCAVVCDASCPADWTEIRDLPLAVERSGVRLYMSPSRSPAAP